MIDFIGIGAQKSGTSWAYACLYEHPQICAPLKEIHFFSRPRFEKGQAWYENHFRNCNPSHLKGEFSTSYLYSTDAPLRIKSLYPEVKLIAILRNPSVRAYSQYRNAIKAGEISDTLPFTLFMEREKSVLEQGKYAEQLSRYYEQFSKEQILVLIYEDIRKNPKAFMQKIYAFLGIDTSFESSMLYTEINVARTPKAVSIDRIMHHCAESLRRFGFDTLVHYIRKTGVTDVIRSYNTKAESATPVLTADFSQYFYEDVRQLSSFLNRDLVSEWNIQAP